MAEQIKYVSLSNLTKYDEKIKAHIQTKDDALKSNLEGQIEVVANALDAEILRAKGAESTNAAAAEAAQTDVDNLEKLVGTLPDNTTATTVVDYINAKTANIASDETVAALDERVTQAEADIDAVEGRATSLETAVADRYTKSEIDTKVDALTQANTSTQGEVDALEKTVADNKTAIESTVTKLEEKVDANESDIEEKMTALTGRVSANETAVQTTLPNAITAEKERAEAAESGLQTQINTIMNNPDTEGVINSINEFTQYIADHGEIAEGFRTDIDANADAISDMDTAYKAADTTLQGNIDAEATARANADSALDTRLKAVESAVGESGSVAEDISAAKQEAIDSAVSTAAADATSKANTAESNAKSHADGLNTAMNERVEALEAIDHDHSNKALLDTYTQTEANLADAVAKKHEHSNFNVLEGITSAKVTTWDTVTSKAAQADLTAEVNRATAKEEELQAAINAFQPCTDADINALFA